MIHAEQITRAVASLVQRDGVATFSRKQVRDTIGLKPLDWMRGYSPIFQGMRSDNPGVVTPIRAKFKNVFQRVSRGRYTLTPYGEELVKQYIQEQEGREPLGQ